MEFIYNDGGRKSAGFRGDAGDCVTRAIAIATQIPYREVYAMINSMGKESPKHRLTRVRGQVRYVQRSSARTGVLKPDTRRIMAFLGWTWTPTMAIGSGCKVHLKADELPKGRIIASVSKHLVAVIDGVIHDTYDCSRDGTRCVYGYYSFPTT